MNERPNGLVRTLTAALVALILLVGGGLGGIALGSGKDLRKHEMQFGHTGMSERVKSLEENDREIKDELALIRKDVKELLRRSGP